MAPASDGRAFDRALARLSRRQLLRLASLAGVELTNTCITSGSDGSDVSATWERFKLDNPHVKYHSARRGYIACSVTPAALRADYKVLERVTTPNEPARVGGSRTVEAGRPGLETS